MFVSRFMPCAECGASVERDERPTHTCDPERLLDYRLFGLRDEIAALETRVREHLASSRGRFEVWLAARDVRTR
ncbi:MAG: hypothetical protein WB798_01610 [Nocardioidaceae bacterium]